VASCQTAVPRVKHLKQRVFKLLVGKVGQTRRTRLLSSLHAENSLKSWKQEEVTREG
jgi:hypothetical protein